MLACPAALWSASPQLRSLCACRYIEMMNEDIRNAFQASGGLKSAPAAVDLVPPMQPLPLLLPQQQPPRSQACWLLLSPQVANPFVFKYVRQLKQERLDDSGSCVLMATPSMLQVPLSSPLRPECTGPAHTPPQHAYLGTTARGPFSSSHPPS